MAQNFVTFNGLTFEWDIFRTSLGPDLQIREDWHAWLVPVQPHPSPSFLRIEHRGSGQTATGVVVEVDGTRTPLVGEELEQFRIATAVIG